MAVAGIATGVTASKFAGNSDGHQGGQLIAGAGLAATPSETAFLTCGRVELLLSSAARHQNVLTESGVVDSCDSARRDDGCSYCSVIGM